MQRSEILHPMDEELRCLELKTLFADNLKEATDVIEVRQSHCLFTSHFSTHLFPFFLLFTVLVSEAFFSIVSFIHIRQLTF